jgi:hypothetical protein
VCYNLNVIKGCDQRKKGIEIMTNKEFFTAIINANLSNEITDKASTMLAQLSKERAAAAKRVNSKRAEANAPIVEAILAHIKANPMALTADIAAAIGATTPKVSSLLTTLTNEGKVESSDVKIKGKGTRKAWMVTIEE